MHSGQTNNSNECMLQNFFFKYSFVLILLFLFCARKDTESASYLKYNKVKTSFGDLAYVTNDCHSKNKSLIFIHGSPGNHTDFNEYISDTVLNERYCIILIDRLGYGDSEKMDSVPDIFHQSSAVYETLEWIYKSENLTIKSKTFIGHSYGGPIALLLFEKDRGHSKSCVLLASPLLPQYEEIQFYNKILQFRFFQFFVSKEIQHSNDEMITLKSDLEKLNKILQSSSEQLNGKIILVHGEKDWLVPVSHTTEWNPNNKKLYLKKIIIEGENHFIPWTQKAKIKEIIRESNE